MGADHWWNGDVTSYLVCNCVENYCLCNVSTLCMFIFTDMEVSESDEEHLSHMEM
jgi:hypothetical protein